MASGRYHVLVMVHSGLGEHLLDVSLDGLAISFALPVRAVCHLTLTVTLTPALTLTLTLTLILTLTLTLTLTPTLTRTLTLTL